MEQELLLEILRLKNELAAMLLLMKEQQAALTKIEIAVLALSQGK